ncbi:uncharacterized protein [Macaca fascicularis]|uniref:uncharacterized protein n=1 Tax=Macaca fascicularis TaxID=9541 RepID=UPI003D1585FD
MRVWRRTQQKEGGGSSKRGLSRKKETCLRLPSRGGGRRAPSDRPQSPQLSQAPRSGSTAAAKGGEGAMSDTRVPRRTYLVEWLRLATALNFAPWPPPALAASDRSPASNFQQLPTPAPHLQCAGARRSQGTIVAWIADAGANQRAPAAPRPSPRRGSERGERARRERSVRAPRGRGGTRHRAALQPHLGLPGGGRWACVGHLWSQGDQLTC